MRRYLHFPIMKSDALDKRLGTDVSIFGTERSGVLIKEEGIYYAFNEGHKYPILHSERVVFADRNGLVDLL